MARMKKAKPVRRMVTGLKPAKRKATAKATAKAPIRMAIINQRISHFAVYFERPGRIEVSLIAHPTEEGRQVVVAFVGDGVSDTPKEPIGVFDGARDDNGDWTA